jgi:hypothetical protein
MNDPIPVAAPAKIFRLSAGCRGDDPGDDERDTGPSQSPQHRFMLLRKWSFPNDAPDYIGDARHMKLLRQFTNDGAPPAEFAKTARSRRAACRNRASIRSFSHFAPSDLSTHSVSGPPWAAG